MVIIRDRLAAHAAWWARLGVGDGRLVEQGDVLSGADLRGAYLRNADLSGADLRGADLRGADLSYADLSGADLRGAYPSYADLRGADLRGADLRGADLRGAYLSYADLSGAIGIAYRRECGYHRRTIIAQRIDGCVLVTAGCRRETPVEVVEAIERQYACDPALRDAYIRAVREIEAEVLAWPAEVTP